MKENNIRWWTKMHHLAKLKQTYVFDEDKISVGDVVKVTFLSDPSFPNRKWWFRRSEIDQNKTQAYAIVNHVFEDSLVLLLAEEQFDFNKEDKIRPIRDTYLYMNQMGVRYDVEVVLRRSDLQ
jgi:hypothetical protein